jgi:hypothetical protein
MIGSGGVASGNPREKAMAESNNHKRPERSQTDDPAKGGVTPADPKTHSSGDSPKPAGDKLQHAVDEAAERKKKAG